MEGSNVTLFIAFTAGFLSFISPCVLPIVPSFLGFLSGMTLEQMTSEDASERAPVILYTLWFVAGFSLIFVALGASATVVGGLLIKYQAAFRMVGGALIIVLGLHFMRVINIGFLQAERRFHLKSKPMGAMGSFLVGITFGLGWTPCIGPILGTILMVAASEGSVARGVLLLSAYSLGFAIPFLLAAAAVKMFLSSYRRLAKHMPKVMFVSGAFLIVVGVLLMTNRFVQIAAFTTQVFSGS